MIQPQEKTKQNRKKRFFILYVSSRKNPFQVFR